MERLFYPRRLVVVGASRNPRKVGSLILKNILESNYEGELTAVNPHEDSIMGVPTVHDVSVIKAPIDVAIIAIPAQAVPEVLEQLGERRCKYAVIISSGYGETDKKGEEREEELVKIANRYNITLVGPNCLGVINASSAAHAYNGSFALSSHIKGSVSLISQSGALISSALDYGAQAGFGFNKVISIGNQADLDVLDGISYLAEDDSTDAIAVYVEGLKHAEKLMKTLLEIEKPVILLKPGSTNAAKEAISSHTGSLAGEERVIRELFEEVNAIQVDSLEEMLSTMHLFSMHQNVSKRDVGVVTNAGGVGVIAVDTLSRAGLSLASLQKKTQEALKDALPDAAAVSNPVDVLGDAGHEEYHAAVQAVLEEGEVGSVVVVVTPQIMTPIKKIAEALRRLAKQYPHKPLVPIFVGGDGVQPAFDLLQGKLPVARTPSVGIEALARLYHYSENPPNKKLWSRPTRYVKKQSLERVGELISEQRTAGATALDFDTISVIGEEFDIPFPKFDYVEAEEQLGEIWKSYQKPVAMKAVAPDVLHRSDEGKVETNLLKLPDAKAFYRREQDQTVIMQQQIMDGVEMFAGIKTDRQFGKVLVVGLGGIYAEIIDDTAVGILPITKPRIWRLLKQTKSYQVLKGARGTVYDTQFLVDTIYNIHLFAISFEEVKEIDVNPLIVQETGGYVVDMKVLLKE